jgi:hypothetical protein
MATSTIILSIAAAVPSDGSASNAAPAIVRFQGTEANPKKHFLAAAFDAAADEHLSWTFRMPADYVSGGAVKLEWMANATANSAVWGARIAAVTAGDADTPVEHAAAAASTTTTATNATEARRGNATSITLANLDSVAAGDLVFLLVYRDADNASDTLTVDAELIAASLEYTS